ncbi:MAG: MBL fold metallo-hydrolase [Candidatus Aramenus sp.]|nr:MBL fold metallo-hydrolase [Candidatus Aramenus sp.]
MEIVPLAFESLGVRSQATFVETKDVRILIDPAVSLAPRRFGLPPHQREVNKLSELAKVIVDKAKVADMIIVTHYHYDHHDPGYVIPKEIYKGKKVFIKDPNNMINTSQKRVRAPKFLRAIKDLPISLEVAEGKEVRIGNTKITFSNAVPHGADERLGYVVQVAISDGDQTLLVTSDIEGAPRDSHLEFTLRVKPNVLIIDGPLSYLLGYALTEEDLNKSLYNMEKIVKEGLDTMIVDHHVLRDQNYRQVLSRLYEEAREVNARVITAAEYLNVEPLILEARRRELFKEENKPARIPRNLAQLLRVDS